MKIFGLIIIKQRTMDNLCEWLADDRKDACLESARKARVVPNKIISKLLWQIHSPNKEVMIREHQDSLAFNSSKVG